MINVQLSGEFAFSNTDVMKRDYLKALATDCWMKISINGEVFYDDWVCPLELYFQYLRWKEHTLKNNMQSFHYVSDDNAANPILSFCYMNDQWAISSCLVVNHVYQGLSTEDIFNFFNSFEEQLFAHKV